MFIGIKDGKIWDMCSRIENKRNVDSIPDNEYIYVEEPKVRYYVDDTWDFIKKVSLLDSPRRDIPPDKTPEELIAELEIRLVSAEEKIVILEEKVDDLTSISP